MFELCIYIVEKIVLKKSIPIRRDHIEYYKKAVKLYETTNETEFDCKIVINYSL